MPQGPIPVFTTNTAGGTNNKLNLSAGTYLLKASSGRIGKIAIVTAGASANWIVYDVAVAANIAATNLVWEAAFGAANVIAGAVEFFSKCNREILPMTTLRVTLTP